MGSNLPPEFFDLAGMTGVALYLGSYAALQLGAIRGSGYPYASLNLAAAAFILVSLAGSFNLWSAVIQVSWIVISVVGITRYHLLTRATRFTDEERALVSAWFPDLAPPDAGLLLRAGTWIDGAPGDRIAQQGEVIGFLYFLTEGGAEVSAGGKPVGRLVAPSVVGELTCFNGGPASATVTLSAPSRLFAVDTGALEKVCRKAPDLRLNLQTGLARDTHAKLAAANRKLSAG